MPWLRRGSPGGSPSCAVPAHRRSCTQTAGCVSSAMTNDRESRLNLELHHAVLPQPWSNCYRPEPPKSPSSDNSAHISWKRFQGHAIDTVGSVQQQQLSNTLPGNLDNYLQKASLAALMPSPCFTLVSRCSRPAFGASRFLQTGLPQTPARDRSSAACLTEPAKP